jgi:hypothetical protein
MDRSLERGAKLVDSARRGPLLVRAWGHTVGYRTLAGLLTRFLARLRAWLFPPYLTEYETWWRDYE